MVFNYLVITLRNMARNKLFTFINIAGISVSLACCTLLFLFVTRELSYDEHHNDLVFRITSEVSQKDGQVFKLASSSVPVSAALRLEVPEIEESTRAANSSLFGGKNVITYEQDSWYIEDGYFIDTTFFSVLDYSIIRGNFRKPLSHNNSVVLEKEWAQKIFGDDDPVGKIIKISTTFGQIDYEVTAVYDKSAHLTHLAPTFMISMSNSNCDDFFNRNITTWIGNNLVFTYVKLVPGSDPQAVNEKIHAILLTHGAEDMKAMGLNKKMDLQPIASIHTTQGFMINTPDTTNLLFIRVLILIGIIILVLACVNYINLSTAQSGKRALEVGVRKVMGVTPRGLVGQFLGESFLIVFFALVLGIIMVFLALPYFNQVIRNPLQVTPDSVGIMVLYLFVFLIFTGFVAGLYPAVYLASFKPTLVLKGRGREKAGTSFIRKGLVIFQFIISITLISAIIIISKQVNYIKNKELGFSPATKLVIPMNTEEAVSQYEVLRNKYESNASVNKVTGSTSVPGSPIVNDLLLYKEGQTMDDAIHIYNNDVDIDFAQVLGLKVLSGTYFEDFNRDTTRNKILISEQGVKQLGLSMEEAPGQMLYMDWQGIRLDFQVVGVVNDIHQFSLHEKIDPLMYTIRNDRRFNHMLMDVNFENFQGLIADLEGQWKQLIPNTPFSYFTLDDHLLKQYEGDFKTFNLIKYFAIISLVISCMGLYAMSMFLAERRFREIGIRKAFGAGIKHIVIMVSFDLSKLVIIAYILSIPISYFAMNKWLESFAFRVTPSAGNYIVAGLISLLIGWITISYQSVRAARTNPVDVLRDE